MPSLAPADDDDALGGLTQDELVDASEVSLHVFDLRSQSTVRLQRYLCLLQI